MQHFYRYTDFMSTNNNFLPSIISFALLIGFDLKKRNLTLNSVLPLKQFHMVLVLDANQWQTKESLGNFAYLVAGILE